MKSRSIFAQALAVISAIMMLAAPSVASGQVYRYPEDLLKGKNCTKITDLEQFEKLNEAVKAYLAPTAGIRVPVRVNAVYALEGSDSLYISFVRNVADYPFRPSTVSDLNRIASENLPECFEGKKPALFINGQRIDMLVTPFYDPDDSFAKRQRYAEEEKKEGRLAQKLGRKDLKKSKEKGFVPPLKYEEGRPFDITAGLDGKHIAMSNSHGWFYEPSLDRWEFQRARLFGVVEDTYTMSYVVPFLTPMLENAGAVVMMPKERDWNRNEVIVDNDTNREGYNESNGTHAWATGDSLGFANPKKSYVFGENPFRMGSYVQTEGLGKKHSAKGEEIRPSYIAWLPDVPESGDYAVYISYHSLPESTKDARYKIKYNGGETEFVVNQQLGGGIWVYLGTFNFRKGAKDQGVYLTNEHSDGIVTADACKFGGGMGNIARGEGEGFVSGMPRFMEGARYWLQWSGFPDTVYSSTNNEKDYTDDFVSRGKWVNRLAGGSSALPEWGEGSEKIPVDLSFSFHTDAGNFLGDSIVGTLSIYTRTCEDFGGGNYYPNGEDRIQGRYLADIVQTQLVDDVSAKYGFGWTRRGLWDRSYAESRAPQVPAMLLEFLSHHNFADMKFGLDPAFRFVASRAIYKGILKYLAMKNNTPYVVQPLPVNNMAVVLENASDEAKAEAKAAKNAKKSRKAKAAEAAKPQQTVRGRSTIDAGKDVYAVVSWSAVEDSLESTAVPTGYVVYTALEDEGYDRGVFVKDPQYRVKIDPGKVYRFKVTAVNEGGESFPSEVVAVGVPKSGEGVPAVDRRNNVVLVVNAFDRVGAPKWMQSKDSTFAGFFPEYDHGVPYIKDASYLGAMYEYRRCIPWTDDDAPGFGGCYNDKAGTIIAGNTFDYAYDHGKAFLAKGYCFVSSTRSAVENGKTRMSDYEICDLIMGKQAQSNDGALTEVVSYEAYTPAMRAAIEDFCKGGRKLLLSGAYVATDLVDACNVDSSGAEFAKNVLKIKWMTHSASKDGKVAAVNNKLGFSGNYEFYSELNDKKYVCEAPDAFTPACEGAYTIFRYPQSSISAAVAYDGRDYKVVTFGFPIETLKSQEQIDSLIGEVVEFFNR